MEIVNDTPLIVIEPFWIIYFVYFFDNLKQSIFIYIPDRIKEGYKSPGIYSVIWNGKNYPSGIYFIVMENESKSLIKKMVLLKWSPLHNVIKYHTNFNKFIF